MHRIIIFDDGRGRLGTMTDLRAAFEVRTGMFTTGARIAATFPKTLGGYWVPAHLEGLLRERGNAPVNTLPDEETLLCVNGRWAMPTSEVSLDVGEVLLEHETGDVVMALLRRADAEYLLQHHELSERVATQTTEARVLYRWPWDVIAHMQETIPHDILSMRLLEAQLVNTSAYTCGEHPIQVHERAHVWPNVVLDATNGPITVHDGATIRPGAVLCGPVAIGQHATVMDQAVIKANTVLGPASKVGGEVGRTIFQGFSNKAHDGHLGDSWIGKWVNFGAGTTNSNLLNTYGEVAMRVEPDSPRQRTGLTFLGCIVGDHVKFAINTRIMTGSVFGTGAMIATTAAPPANVRRFAWLTDAGDRTQQLDKFTETMRTVMARRDREASDAYVNLLREVHARAAG